MRIGLIDCEGGKFPNLPLMKISAFHKSQGDNVEWYHPFTDRYDKVYISRVFSTTPDYLFNVNADKVVRGGTGYDISIHKGKEVFFKGYDLPYEVEHIYPDYSLYGITDTAYGFLTRGCPRGCDFCIVSKKEGKCSVKVADLSEFWQNQKYIVLMDPNILACREWRDLLGQCADSKAHIDFNQGLDIRLMTKEKAEAINACNVDEIHFAWDRYQDKDIILRNLALYAEYGKFKPHSHNAIVYTIVNFNTTFEQDLERIYTLRELGYWAYVMIYDKEHCDIKYRHLQRWVNNRFIFAKCDKFEDYATSRR